MSFGQTLRTAREAKGITPSELASRTHLLVQIIEGLENEDFRRIPAPIYGRGFVKLYCEVVGLDPKPLQAEFMTLYKLNKETPAKISRTPPPSPTPQTTPHEENTKTSSEPPPTVTIKEMPPPDPEPTPAIVETENSTTFKPSPTVEEANQAPLEEPPPAVEKSTPVEPEPPPRRSYGELFEQTYAQEEPEKISAAEKFRDTMSNVSHGVFANVKKLPPNTGRIVMVCIAAVILLVLMGWGIAALYSATSPQPTQEKPQADKPALQTKQETTEKPLPTTDKAISTPKAPLPPKRTKSSGDGKSPSAKPGTLKASGIQIPSLYID